MNQPGPGPEPEPNREPNRLQESQPQPAPPVRQVSADDETLAGVYATNMIIMSTREEFMVDFMSNFPPKSRVVARVVLTPGHITRVLKAMQDALQRYEAHFGALPDLVPADKPKTQTNVTEFYKNLHVTDKVLGGEFSNYLEISQRKDDFLMDFQTNFQPLPRLAARVIVPAAAFKRMIPVVANSIKNHEQRFGSIQPGQQPPHPPQPPSEGGFTLN